MKYRDLIKELEADGWYFYQMGKGDHRIYKHQTKPGSIVIDYKPGRDVPDGTLSSIRRQVKQHDHDSERSNQP